MDKKPGPIKSSPIKAVIFDFDGTLTRPGALDFATIKQTVGCPADMPVLEFIHSLSDPADRLAALAALDAFELTAAAASQPNEGAEALIAELKSMGVPVGIISRNSDASILRALDNFDRLGAGDFQVLISRETSVAPKPSPDGVHHAADILGVDVQHIAVVGDYLFDIQAGNRAGAHTVWLDPSSTIGRQTHRPWEEAADHTIDRLGELLAIVRLGQPLSSGKLPNELLQQYLDEFSFEDPSVLINPGVGEDTAALDIDGQEVLILKSDPITFATDAIGHYAVLVNANDIATSGADPRWLLTTLMFPCGVTAADVLLVLRDLKTVCEHWDITLCGGHTEITDAVTRPVVVGMMAGSVARDRLIDKRRMRTGDQVLLTKAVAVEGTSIIAREFGRQLQAAGISATEIGRCRRFLDDISILEEARIAREIEGVSAMHDVTEGGLATALEEFSIAGGHGICVQVDQIPIFDQTQTLCDLLGIDPLGLIGSGSLLIACRQAQCATLIDRIRRAGIAITPIGRVEAPGSGIVAQANGKAVTWPRFEVDEITRLY